MTYFGVQYKYQGRASRIIEPKFAYGMDARQQVKNWKLDLYVLSLYS